MSYTSQTAGPGVDVRVGDKIIVSSVGTVTKLVNEWGDLNSIAHLDNGATVDLRGAREGKLAVEVITRAKLKAGDFVRRDEILARAWGKGTMLKGTVSKETLVRTEGEWMSLGCAFVSPGTVTKSRDMNGEYEVVYLPVSVDKLGRF